ncbi:TPA: hypothetical protein HA274_02860 [Candidatus Bathyarchaeota archaeon]|nr:hypothetical protein [Candidatus Bathyarchaeota archaeon]
MSIINFQTSIMADHETYSETASGQPVTDAEAEVTETSINTYADDGERIFNADFGTGKNYQLYNYTADPTEAAYDTYESAARTARIAGFAGNGGLFAYHIGLMKFLPAVVVHMYPALFAKAASTISDMSRANYFYTIAYPEYSGYRIEHDPTFTAYIAATNPTPDGPLGNTGAIIVIALIAVAVGIGAVAIIARKKRN